MATGLLFVLACGDGCGGSTSDGLAGSGGADPTTEAPPTNEPDPVRPVALQVAPIVGELSDTSLRVVVQLGEPGFVTLRAKPFGAGEEEFRHLTVAEGEAWAGQASFERLLPDTRYEIAVWAHSRHLGRDVLDSTPAWSQVVRTAPAADDPAPLRFAFGGDLAGQNVCRDAETGFPLLGVIADREPRFFIGLGDMIYGDGPCTAEGAYGNRQVAPRFRQTPSETVFDYLQRWANVQTEDGLLPLFRAAPYYAVWDDHEVANDFDPGHAQLAAGRAAFLATNPIPDEDALRTFRWGRHVDLVLLDTRRHRAPNADTGEKSMLGETQRGALLAHIRASEATWLLIVTSMPLTVPTGHAHRDGWADGMDVVDDGEWSRVEAMPREPSTLYEAEARQILETVRAAGKRVVFLSADVHFAEVLRLHPFDDDFVAHEVVVGPLNAGLFPNRALDASFRPERLFFHGPETVDPRWEQALRWFNYGEVAVDEAGALTVEVRGMGAEPLYELRLAAR